MKATNPTPNAFLFSLLKGLLTADWYSQGYWRDNYTAGGRPAGGLEIRWYEDNKKPVTPRLVSKLGRMLPVATRVAGYRP